MCFVCLCACWRNCIISRTHTRTLSLAHTRAALSPSHTLCLVRMRERARSLMRARARSLARSLLAGIDAEGSVDDGRAGGVAGETYDALYLFDKEVPRQLSQPFHAPPVPRSHACTYAQTCTQIERERSRQGGREGERERERGRDGGMEGWRDGGREGEGGREGGRDGWMDGWRECWMAGEME